MTIDVLIPVGGKSKFLEQALISASSQKGDFKLYVIENNVGDAAYSAYLRQQADKYGAHYVHFDQRLPISGSWQRCLTVGKSEWITYLHDDDIWPHRHIASCEAALKSLDMLFVPYRFFRDELDTIPTRDDGTVELPKSREHLLATMLNSYNHACSTFFRRSLNLRFHPTLLMALEQYAFRQCVADNESVRVGWLHTKTPVPIRQHSQQFTWTGVMERGAVENAVSYRDFVAAIKKENLNIGEFARQLAQCYDRNILSRVFSSILFGANSSYAWRLLRAIPAPKGDSLLVLSSLARSLLQDKVWKAKSRMNSLRRRFSS